METLKLGDPVKVISENAPHCGKVGKITHFYTGTMFYIRVLFNTPFGQQWMVYSRRELDTATPAELEATHGRVML